MKIDARILGIYQPLLIVLLVWASSTRLVSANVISVSSGAGTLQAAIDDASTVDGDTLELTTGDYTDSADVTSINLTKSLPIRDKKGELRQ